MDPLVLRSSHLAPPTLVPIMQSAPTRRTIWAINVTVSQGGKVRNFCLCHFTVFPLIVKIAA